MTAVLDHEVERVGRLEIPGLHSGPVTVLATNLDGTVWVRMHSTRSALCVTAREVTGVELPAPANPYQLTPTEIEVLIEFASAGRTGLADFEHKANAATVAEARRTLIARGLVMERRGESRSTSTRTGHVWAITGSGTAALRPPHPA